MPDKENNFLSENRDFIVILLLSLLVLVIYWQATDFEFILFDDRRYIFENAVVLSGLNWDSIKWAFTTFHMANWHPLTWLTHLADVSLFGLNAGAHHATNVVFHIINTILAFIVFKKFTGSIWKSAIVAALFASHPAHIESVAWVAERKDVLSTMFWLLTMFAYLKFVKDETPGEPGENLSSKSSLFRIPASKYYLLTLLLFALGLMAKPMLVTLPFVLILMDFWALERLKNFKDIIPLAIEKLPLFALSIASGIITILAQRSGGAVQTLEMLPFSTRFQNAIISYAKYIVMLFYPVNLSVWYPYEKSISVLEITGSFILLAAITAFCIWQIKRRKYLLMGWLWFLGTLVPVIGLLQVGSQSHADRYTYVPYFGLFIMLVWGISEAFEKIKINKYAPTALALIVILIFSAMSFRHVSRWQNDETLYRHALSVTENNYILSLNYCYALMLQDRLEEAAEQCRNSISYNPKYVETYISYGVVQIKQGKFAEAEENFKKALEMRPAYKEIYINLATAQSLQGKTEEAEKNLEKAAGLMPFEANPQMWINAISNLANAYTRQKKHEKAEENFRRALRLAPDKTDIRANFVFNLYTQKKFAEAQKQIEVVLKQKPDQPEAYNLYGLILLEQNKTDKAKKAFEKALKLKPDFKEARKNLEKTK